MSRKGIRAHKQINNKFKKQKYKGVKIKYGEFSGYDVE